MTPTPEQTPSKKSIAGRTSLITAAAIAGVVLAGTAAIAANVGILNAGDSGELGELSAADDLLPAASQPSKQVIDVYLDEVTTTPPTTDVGAASSTGRDDLREYAVDAAGVVRLAHTGDGLRVDTVTTNAGWSAAPSRPDGTTVVVEFTNAGRTVVFTASLGPDGDVIVDVTEPITVTGTTPGVGAAGAPSFPVDDDHEFEDEFDDDDEDDDDFDDDEDEDDDFDDDEDEYEGRDDDD